MGEVRSAAEAVAGIESGWRVFVHGAAATPNALLRALEARDDLRDVELVHLHTMGPAHYAKPDFAERFRVTSLFVGENLRPHTDSDRVDYLPCFLSEIPSLLRSGKRRLHAALLHVSPPDAHGWCTLGVSVDVARAAVDAADVLIAQVNPQMPRVHGDGFVHLSRFDRWVGVDAPLPEAAPAPPGDVERRIARQVAERVEDGATLQMGIGAIPDAVLAALHGHRHLGIHTEMWSDGCLDLIASGAVDGSRKKIHPGKVVSGFVVGTRRSYDFLHDNPSAVLLDIAYVNDPSVIAKNPKVTAINSAVEIDLTGQVCADSIGHRTISGVGGQMDFMRGASLSPGGRPILALPSRTARGRSRIVAALQPGAGVVTTRSHVHDVVTEWGVAELYGKTLGERARALIAIAHPDDRDALTAAWRAARRG